MQSIILVDDEEHFRERLARAFSTRGYKVFEAEMSMGHWLA